MPPGRIGSSGLSAQTSSCPSSHSESLRSSSGSSSSASDMPGPPPVVRGQRHQRSRHSNDHFLQKITADSRADV
eukprot:456875-Lingulodinium_polyedra.AAC.1